jgi:hypothetical protein
MNSFFRAFSMATALCASISAVVADQVQMQNGDRYHGKILLVSSNMVVLENANVGTLKLPRNRVSSIQFQPDGAGVGSTNSTVKPSSASTNISPEVAAALESLKTGTNGLRQSPAQLLEGAGPEAQTRFNELASGLLTGKLNIADLRREAQAVLQQARSLRSELDPDTAASLDGYLAILESFVKRSEPLVASPKPSAEKPQP